MYFVEKTLSNMQLDASILPNNFNHENVCFFDIETSGLSPKTSPVFLIGLVFFKDKDLILRQYFSCSNNQEVDILNAFIEDIKYFEYIYHYNGLSFDIPFINERLSYNNINFTIKKESSIDLYQIIKKNKDILKLESCKLKSVEQYLGIFREDDLSGKEVADSYKFYTKTLNNYLRDKIILHNEEDILNLYKILPILKTIDNIKHPVSSLPEINDTVINVYEENVQINGCINLNLENINVQNNNYKFSWNKQNNNFTLDFPILDGLLYYWFQDYKQYYYIPELDEAVHKTVVNYYKFGKKITANSENCYSKQFTSYIKLPTNIKALNIKACSEDIVKIVNCISIDEINKNIDNSELVQLISLCIEKILSEK